MFEQLKDLSSQLNEFEESQLKIHKNISRTRKILQAIKVEAQKQRLILVNEWKRLNNR